MTVIVGVLCTDGAVFVADGAATYCVPSGDIMTIRQSTRKLIRISRKQMLGVSGAIALGQTFADLFVAASKQSNTTLDVRAWTRAEIRKIANEALYNQCIGPAVTKSTSVINMCGNRGYQNDAIQHSLYAFVDEHSQPQLAQITPTCQVEFADKNLPFVCVGSGQPAADPFMAFLRDVFCAGQDITLQDGKFLAYWAVDLTIRVQPGMVAHPIQMMVLQKKDNNWQVEELTDEVEDHAEMVKTMENKMRAHRSITEEIAAIPAPPQKAE